MTPRFWCLHFGALPRDRPAYCPEASTRGVQFVHICTDMYRSVQIYTNLYNLYRSVQSAHIRTICTDLYNLYRSVQSAHIRTICTYPNNLHRSVQSVQICTICTICTIYLLWLAPYPREIGGPPRSNRAGGGGGAAPRPGSGCLTMRSPICSIARARSGGRAR